MSKPLSKMFANSELEMANHSQSSERSILESISDIDSRLTDAFNERINEINKYVLMLESPKDLENRYSKMRVLNNLSYGFRKATEAVAWSSILLNRAKTKRKSAEAVALHDNFWEYSRKREEAGKPVKTSDTFIKSYVDIDPDVIKAREEEAIVTAMYFQFLGLKQEFSQGISTIKLVSNPYSEEQQMTSSAGPINDDQVPF